MAYGETYGSAPSARPWPDNRPTLELGGRGTVHYRVEYDGEALHQTGTDRLAVEAKLELEAGTDGSLSITIGADNPMSENAEERFRLMDPDHEVRVTEDGYELFRGRITGIRGDMDVNVTIEAEGQLSYLRDTLVPPVANYTDDSFPVGTTYLGQDEPFDWFVRNHNDRADASKAFRPGSSPKWVFPFSATNWPTTRDAMDDALCQSGFTFVNARSGPGGERILDLIDDGVEDSTQTVVLGENMLDYAKWGAADDIATAIVGVGRWPEEDRRAATSTGSYETEDPEDNPPYVPEEDPEDNPPFGQGGDRDPNTQLDEDRTFGLETVDDGVYNVLNTTLQVDGDRAISPELCALYGIVEKRREYDATEPGELLECIAEELDPESPMTRRLVSLDVDALDLHKVNPDIRPILLLDWVRLYSPAHHLDQWLPCTGMSLDLCEPERSTYHFGDIPGTLTRENALRVARTRLGDGYLVRRLDGQAWNGERLWDHQQQTWDQLDEIVSDEDLWHEDVEGQLVDMTAGLDDLIAQYGAMGGNIDDLRDYLNGRIDAVDHKSDGLIDDIEVAIAGAQRTQYGVCITGASTAAKAVTVSVPGDTQGRWPFTLTNGAVVTVRFQNANTAASATLNVNNTGSRYIMTNGLLGGFWQAGATSRFVFDGTYWQAASTNLYGQQAIIGNPGQANFYTDGNKFSLRISETDLIRGDWDGLQVGMDGHPNVLVHSSYIDLRHSNGAYARFGYDSDNGNIQIKSSTSLALESSTGTASILLGRGDTYVHGSVLHLTGSQLYLWDGTHPVVQRSIVVNPGGHSYANVAATSVGLTTCAGYAWVVSNGDLQVGNVAVTSVSYNSSTRGITVHFADSHTGQVRVNLWGFYCSTQWSDPGLPGPEMSDAGADEAPTYELPEEHTEEVA